MMTIRKPGTEHIPRTQCGALMKKCSDCDKRWVYPHAQRCSSCAQQYRKIQDGTREKILAREKMIRRLRSEGWTLNKIARELGVNPQRVSSDLKRMKEQGREAKKR